MLKFKSIIVASSITLLFSANVLAKEVFLECVGTFTFCAVYPKDSLRCDRPAKDIAVISIDENSITQKDGRGFLTFKKESCAFSDTYFQCSEFINTGSLGSVDEEYQKRNLYIVRSTGVASWSYDAKVGPENPRFKNATLSIGTSSKYEGQCKIRENKNLF